MTYRFDRDELFSLAGWLRQVAADVDETQYQVQAALSAVRRWSQSTAALSETADSCLYRARDLADRAIMLGGLSAVRWGVAEDGAEKLGSIWERIRRFAGSDNDPRLDSMLRVSGGFESDFWLSLDGLLPAETAAVTAGLPLDVGRRLAWRYPVGVASNDGLPVAWRAMAARQLMRTEAGRLRGRIQDGPPADADEATARLRLLDGWLASDRTFIWFDPSGDGQLVEVVGDFATAEAVGVFVPGISSDLATFEAVASHARGFVAAASKMDRNIAVVAWLGYDAPAGIGLNLEAVLPDHAKRGAPDLVRFVDGIAAQRPDAQITVVAHSYGSVVAGWAAAFDHLHADRLVFVGSPNVAVDNVSGLTIPDPARVFVGEAPLDPVVAIGDFTDGWRDDWSGLGHGYDPGDCDWGATVFDVQDVGLIEAHVTYSSGQSAESIVHVMLGEEDHIADRCD